MRRTPELAGLRFSPDGNRLALELMEREFSSIWVYEWERDTLSRLASGSNSVLPTWSPKGLHIAFMSVREGTQNLYLKRADGSTAEAQRLTQGVNRQAATSWHPSGRFLAFTETAPETRADIMILPMEGDDESGWKAGEPSVFLNGPANESFATFSPDGRWLACQSDETGTDEVYVRPFPGPGGKFPVSTNGGTAPLWSPSSKELFYGRSGRIMVTAYSVDGDSFRADKPRLWSEGGYAQRNGYPFGVHTDGQRLAVAMNPVDPAPAPSKLVFILNLAEELRRLAPPSGK
jgi:serine/threonine-protein kinase